MQTKELTLRNIADNLMVLAESYSNRRVLNGPTHPDNDFLIRQMGRLRTAANLINQVAREIKE